MTSQESRFWCLSFSAFVSAVKPFYAVALLAGLRIRLRILLMLLMLLLGLLVGVIIILLVHPT